MDLLFVLAQLSVMHILMAMIPGPNTVVVTYFSARESRAAGLMAVAGIVLGSAIWVILSMMGVGVLLLEAGAVYRVLRLLGAAYLVLLAVKLILAREDAHGTAPAKAPRGGYFTQAMMVEISNPKGLLFFGAFFPQFIDPAGNAALQILVMGVTAMAVAAMTDTVYVLAAARLATGLSSGRARALRWGSGSLLVAGGLWLALKGE